MLGAHFSLTYSLKLRENGCKKHKLFIFGVFFSMLTVYAIMWSKAGLSFFDMRSLWVVTVLIGYIYSEYAFAPYSLEKLRHIYRDTIFPKREKQSE